MILIGPFKKTTNCDRHVASKPNKRSGINIQICAKFMIEGNIKYICWIYIVIIICLLHGIYDNGNESTQIKNIKCVFSSVFSSVFQVFFQVLL